MRTHVLSVSVMIGEAPSHKEATVSAIWDPEWDYYQMYWKNDLIASRRRLPRTTRIVAEELASEAYEIAKKQA